MGVYLSSPVTDKESIDGQSERFVYGASSMQGWRITQEDAHNCIPLFDEKTNTSFFAVYDGHGGSEVAKYCERHFPEFVKKLLDAEGGTGDATNFIKKAFLEFDETLTDDDVVKQLKELAGKDDDNEDDDDCDPLGRSEAELLKEEANMPLDQLLAQYKCLTPDGLKNSDDSASQSPALRDKSEACSPDGEDGPSSSVCTLSSGTSIKPHTPNSSSQCSNGKESVNKSSENSQPQTSNSVDMVKDSSSSSLTNCKSDSDSTAVSSTQPSAPEGDSPASAEDIRGEADGCSSSESAAYINRTGTSAISLRSALPEPDGSEKGPLKDAGPSGSGSSAKPRKKVETTETTTALDGYLDTSDDEDDDDDDDDDDEEDLWEDMSDDEDDEEDDEDEAEDDAPMMHMSDEEPGSDSGCTACVVLMQGKKLVVANAGDSRCVLSRAGKAVELSFDHKPEDDTERERIEHAGGKVTADGRVNGGLNLSRAIGDHVYKRNKDLPAEEQMITALPDIETAELCDDDQFLIIACDGIWNYLSSQEAVDFVLEKFKDPELRKKPSAVCEALFDHCLAPNTAGDGTGCDNMTCIIVVLDTFLKPSAEPPTPKATNTQEAVVKNSENSLEKQLPTVDERGDAGAESLKRCADDVEVRDKKRAKVEEEVV